MRRAVADTFAMITFTTAVGAASELFIVGLTLEQTLITRLGAIPANLLSSRPYGIYRDFVMRLGNVHLMHGPRGKVMRFLMDTLAFTSFKMPLYALLLKIAGASWSEVWLAIASAIFLTIALGRVFGMYLDFIRRWFGVPALERPDT